MQRRPPGPHPQAPALAPAAARNTDLIQRGPHCNSSRSWQQLPVWLLGMLPLLLLGVVMLPVLQLLLLVCPAAA